MKERYIPHIGQRIVKTTVAVFICLLVYFLLGYRGKDVPAEACITAIICMQPYVSDTRQYALNRFTGTVIGSIWGLLFLMLIPSIPWISSHIPLVYLLMAAGIMLALYSAVLLGKNDASSLAAIVFLCIVISFPDIEDPLKQAALRIGDVFLGTSAAIIVNVFRFPRKKNEDLVIFTRSRDLITKRTDQLDPKVRFKLNKLYSDGAKIGLVSEHAPAFFAMQLSSVKLRVPMIVMDGAAIYDPGKNSYLWKKNIETENCALARKVLDDLNLSYFVYTIHNDRTCIFHFGTMTDAEKLVYESMKSSPYRDYLEGEILEDAEIVYLKVIVEEERAETIEYGLHKALPERPFRIVRRSQEQEKAISGIYIYDHAAETGHAKSVLMQMKYPGLKQEDVVLKRIARSEYDSLHLLNMIENKYEPIKLFGLNQKDQIK